MKLRYAFKRTIANKSAGADKELKPEVPDGMLKKSVRIAVIISVFMQGEESKCWQMKEPLKSGIR